MGLHVQAHPLASTAAVSQSRDEKTVGACTESRCRPRLADHGRAESHDPLLLLLQIR